VVIGNSILMVLSCYPYGIANKYIDTLCA